MKRIALGLVVLVALLVVPVGLYAQGDLTLEGLAEKVSALVGRVDAIESRLLHDAFVTEKGNCELAVPGRLHATSLLSYMEKFTDVDDKTPRPEILSVYHLVEHEDAGATAIVFGVSGDYPIRYRVISEHWLGCEFLSSSGWQSVNYDNEYVEE